MRSVPLKLLSSIHKVQLRRFFSLSADLKLVNRILCPKCGVHQNCRQMSKAALKFQTVRSTAGY